MKIFDKVKGFKRTFPTMIEKLETGKVLLWDHDGSPQRLTEENKEVIKRLEAENDELNIKVYAVIDNINVLGTEPINMVSYLYTNDEACDISRYCDNRPIFYAMSLVVNKTWGFEEMGSILITGSAYGGPRRIG